MVKYEPDQVFAALGTPVRRAMVEHLITNGTLSISDMAKPFSISLPAVLKHASVLEKSGLVVRTKVGRVHYCALNMATFEEVSLWLVSQRKRWEESFDRLEQHIINKRMNNKNKK